jgi:malate synthase
MRNQMITISDCYNGHVDELFNPEFQAKIIMLSGEFETSRQKLLADRALRQAKFDLGEVPTFEVNHPAKTTAWKVAPIPKDLLDRRVEITGPISNSKMVINMLSENQDGEIASTAMLDFEDSMAPTWQNVVSGYKNIISVAAKNLTFIQNELDGSEKVYQLNPKKMALPMVRVRGLHMNEKNFCINGTAVSAGLLDLFTTAFHTAKTFIKDNKTPKFYVPKCEHYLEARWWNEVFTQIEHLLDLPVGTLKVTFLIETLPAAFLIEEIIYENK